LLEGNEFFGSELMIADEMGPRWIQSTKRLIRHPETDEKLVLGFSVDITRRKEVEAELVSAREEAETALRLKSEFIANVSHEIRTPLNGVIGLAELLANTEMTDAQARHLDTLRKSADHLRHTLNDVLDFSKIEAGRMQFELEPIDMARLVEDVVDLYSSDAIDRGLWLGLEVPWDDRYLVIADPHRLHQVFANLISNALKFTLQGGVTVSFRITDRLEVVIKDTGVGIQPERREVIFESFIQEDGSTSRTFGGTGLGLAIVKRLVEAMDGSIECTSTLRVGSTFTVGFKLARIEPIATDYIADIYVSDDALVRVPFLRSSIESLRLRVVTTPTEYSVSGTESGIEIRKAGIAVDRFPRTVTHTQIKSAFLSLHPTTEPVDEKQFVEPVLRKERILVVEDNEVNQFVIAEQLRTFGFEPTLASRAPQALRMMREQPFDLVLMDVQMPEMDGLEATRRIRQTEVRRRTPVVAITAFATNADAERCMEAGMDDYVTKPISLQDLSRVTTKWIKA
jgi:hypothetical protein